MSDSHLSIRCSVAVFSGDKVLLLHRQDQLDWTLPGGTPVAGETLLDCARRELREETGMLTEVVGCGLVVESISAGERLVDLIFVAPGHPAGAPRASESGRRPRFVPVDELETLRLHPPVGRHLVLLSREGGRPTIPCVHHAPS